MKQKLFFLLFIVYAFSHGQKIELGKSYPNLSFDGSSDAHYHLNLKKGDIYLFTVYQNNIDVEVILMDSSGKKVASVDLADGNNGYDKMEFSPEKDDYYKLVIRSVEKEKKPNGVIGITSKKLTKNELKNREKVALGLKKENAKDIMTVDVMHFWEAYDQLKLAKSKQDSIDVIQKIYLDRATDGLREFEKVRYFSAEFFVERIKKYSKFYTSVRNNTMIAMQMENIGSVITEFKKWYPEAKPAKICFVIGPMSTGGTISGNYILIGVEMLAGNKDCDISEITNENLKADILSRNNESDVVDFIKETAVHEYIHTQQRKTDKNACECILLEHIIKEGVASYISEKVLLEKKNYKSRAFMYAKENEKRLWNELKNELCTKDFSKWLFNASVSKDRPGDLGYRMGYNLAEAYYENATDKKSALKEMIEMENPLLFLDQSKYDLKFR
ncbi:DUF2268 domain-containing putative Zn-dependent protease [Chryseobacterium sp. LAM-KRS1]|uniref:DUF2268 domain-containing putative Zn-dependent protease n=1 Tax=Chryseobacterium sp. LAM-KRS1 TaxID=2715754 RepID=UPI001552994A|nr:DUF2268 domain-containing putative Zn-dependent protease [Chryseobacterium sp. LAM-KRS1]